MKRTYISHDEAETLEIAASLARNFTPGTVVALTGDLGAGKTVFVRGVARSLGASDRVTSPTFVLIHEYRGEIPLYHMDLYRLNSKREILAIGVEDYFYSDGISLVEWAEKLEDLLPEDAVRIKISHLDDRFRQIDVWAPPREEENDT